MPMSMAATVMRASSPGASPVDLHRHRQHGAGLDLLGRLQLHVEHARRLVDGEPAQAERAQGMRLAFSSIGR